MALGREQKQTIVSEFARVAQDTGSTQVQVALLTHNIKALTDHCKINPKDHSSRRGLLQMVNDRRSLLSYLQRKNQGAYRELIAKLGLRK